MQLPTPSFVSSAGKTSLRVPQPVQSVGTSSLRLPQWTLSRAQPLCGFNMRHVPGTNLIVDPAEHLVPGINAFAEAAELVVAENNAF